MSRCDGTRPVGDASSMRGSPTRRRLLALLSVSPIIAIQFSGVEQRRASQANSVSNADPVPRLFAEFQALLDRHAAAIVVEYGAASSASIVVISALSKDTSSGFSPSNGPAASSSSKAKRWSLMADKRGEGAAPEGTAAVLNSRSAAAPTWRATDSSAA